MKISEFYAARLDEDEATAKLAAREGGTWTQDDPVRYPGSISSLGGQVVYDEGAPDENQAPHIARHDPARALREVEAKRAILAAHDRAEHYCPLPVLPSRHGQLWTPEEGPCWTLRLLVSIYSDHPDYEAGWSTER